MGYGSIGTRSMAKTTIENPDVHKEQKVQSNGNVYLTTDLSGQQVRIIAEVVDDE